MKALIPLLMLMATPAAAQVAVGNLPPAKPSGPQPTWVACSYFDFNHDLSYASRPFKVDAQLQAGSPELAIFAPGFEAAIKTQYKVPVDARHVTCDTIGAWRVGRELQYQTDLDRGSVKPAANERRVDWPHGDEVALPHKP